MAQDKSSKIHWLVPLTIISSFAIGLVTAIVHHAFYLRLHDQPVPLTTFYLGTLNLQKQQVNTSAGVAIALLVKTSLMIAVSVSYVQIFWHRFKTTLRSPTLLELDWASSCLDNVLWIFNLNFWFQYPVLVGLAMGFWLMPIATVFPPASLSIKTGVTRTSSWQEVPQFDFTSSTFFASLPDGGLPQPSGALQTIASKVMSLGQTLPLKPPQSNSSWALDYWAPSLQCNDLGGSERDDIFKNIWNSHDHSYGARDTPDWNAASSAYLSWLPWSKKDISQWATGLQTHQPYNYSQPQQPFIFDVHLQIQNRSLGNARKIGPPIGPVTTDGPLSIMFATFPNARNVSVGWHKHDLFGHDPKDKLYVAIGDTTQNGSMYNCLYRPIDSLNDSVTNCKDDPTQTFPVSKAFESATLLRCDLHNTSYTTYFNFTSGSMNTQVKRPLGRKSPLVNAFSNQLSLNDPDNFSSPVSEAFAEDLRVMAYQSIMAAFNQQVLGSIKTVYPEGLDFTNSSVSRTILEQTNELAFARPEAMTPGQRSRTLQGHMQSSNVTQWQALVSEKSPTETRGSLKDTLEELFQNYTISLLSDPYFHPNYVSRFAPPRKVKVDFPKTQNVYNYNQALLWVPYSVCIVFAAIVSLAGLAIINLSGASYSNSFSTIVRVAKASDLDTEIHECDTIGRDPLPDYLEKARLQLGPSRVETDSDLVDEYGDEHKHGLVQRVVEVRTNEIGRFETNSKY